MVGDTGEQSSSKCQPPLKWPGGKRWLARQLAPLLSGETNGTYYEPFFGAGAMFLKVGPKDAVVCDINEGLVNCLRVIRDSPESLLDTVWRWSNTRECYDMVRRCRPRTALTRAARFLYLNRTCWGGIYRVNRKGEFNVPFGNSGRPICRKAAVLKFSQALQTVKLYAADFASVIDIAKSGDTVYCDPPYTCKRANGTFIRYNDRLFAWRDQERLAECLRQAVGRGVFVAVSNAWHPAILSLYQGWFAAKVTRQSLVARDVLNRQRTCEALIVSRPPVDWGSHFAESPLNRISQ